METLISERTLKLPHWLRAKLERIPSVTLSTASERMAFALEVLKEHIEARTGGPFAALVVEELSGRLVSVGVNLVTTELDPSAHAEVVAVRFATAARGAFQLGDPQLPALQLVTTGQPCAMCFGMVVWSGIQSLLIGASTTDAEQIAGFDEGPVHPAWREELIKRGIKITEGLMATEVQALYRRYIELGGVPYNGARNNGERGS